MYYSMHLVVNLFGIKILKGDNGRETQLFIKVGKRPTKKFLNR